MNIDVHNHAIPEEAIELLVHEPDFGARVAGSSLEITNHFTFELKESFRDPTAKLRELEQLGIQGAVVSIAPPLFFSHLDAELGGRFCSATNSGLARFCAAAPDRLKWMAHVPIQQPELAATVLAEAVGLGSVGVEVPTRVVNRRLDASEFEEFWSSAERHRQLVLIHPWYNASYPGLEDWYLQNAIGNLLETTIAIERLICAGVLDRHPDLRLLLAHAGGFVPYQAGRLRHAAKVRPELARARVDPWRYVGQIKFDCLTHDASALKYLVERVGVDNVFLGTDLPFDMAEPHPMELLRTAVGLESAKKIAGANAASAFGFPGD